MWTLEASSWSQQCFRNQKLLNKPSHSSSRNQNLTITCKRGAKMPSVWHFQLFSFFFFFFFLLLLGNKQSKLIINTSVKISAVYYVDEQARLPSSITGCLSDVSSASVKMQRKENPKIGALHLFSPFLTKWTFHLSWILCWEKTHFWHFKSKSWSKLVFFSFSLYEVERENERQQ